MWTFFHRLRSSGNVRKGVTLSRSKGFTLIELLLVLSIMLIFTTMFLFRQQQFNSSTLLRTLTYSVALSVRQAQVYGTSVRELDPIATTPTFAPGFGLEFTGANATEYVLYADFNSNGINEGTGERIDKFFLPRGYTIKAVCAITTAGTRRCNTSLDSSGVATITKISILFKRPNPDASFVALNGSTPIAGDIYTNGYIQIQSTDGVTTRAVLVNSTGQIRVCGINKTYPTC